MASNYKKWTRDRQNPEDPVYVVLFTARNKDNKDINGFEERRCAFLRHLPGTTEPGEKLNGLFARFVDEGVPGETSRIYISVNARDQKKIKKMLMHQLIDDSLTGGELALTHMDTAVTSIAAKKECAAERKWLFDVDLSDTDFVSRFCEYIRSNCGVEANYYKTPHGFGVITSHGFDMRILEKMDGYKENKENITLKRDDLLCVKWEKKRRQSYQDYVLIHINPGSVSNRNKRVRK